MKLKLKLAVLVIGLTAAGYTSSAQERFKGGLGINYVSNTYKQAHLYDYFAYSANFSYTFLQASKFGLAIESATSLRVRDTEAYEEANYKFGFTSSLPLVASLNLKKTSFYVGAGPAYVKQVSNTYQHNELASDYYINNIVGVGFKGRSFLGEVLDPEFSVRFSYLKSIKKTSYDGGMVSFIIFLRG